MNFTIEFEINGKKCIKIENHNELSGMKTGLGTKFALLSDVEI
jgi:hypothetical protein